MVLLDVAVGNPPYQSPKNGDHSFWARFIVSIYNHLVPDGYMVQVIPTGWMSPTVDVAKGRVSILRDIFHKNNLVFVDVSKKIRNTYFKEINTDFCWFIMQKSDQYTKTVFRTDEGDIEVDIRNIKYFPLDLNKHSLSIFEKVFSYESKEQFNFSFVASTYGGFETTKDFMHIWKRYNGNSDKLDTPFYGIGPCPHHFKKKVLAPYNGSKYKFLVNNGTCGVTECWIYLLQDNETIAAARSVFKSDLFYYLTNQKRTQYNEGAFINMLPKIDLTRIWSEADLYNLFNINNEEQNYIQQWCKEKKRGKRNRKK